MSKLKLTPIGGNILIKPILEAKKTASGIIIPDTVAKDTIQRGEVIALGTGRLDGFGKMINFNVKVGEQVLFKKGYNTSEVELEGEQYLVMDEDSIIAVIN